MKQIDKYCETEIPALEEFNLVSDKTKELIET